MPAIKKAAAKKVPVKTVVARKAAATKAVTKKAPAAKADSAAASALIDARIAELGGWRGEALARLRAVIKSADPEVVEEWKWGVPVWSHHGIICTGEAYKAAVKATFANGASLPDPAHVFNSSLDGNVRRAIDFREGEKVNETALKALIRAAVEFNALKTRR